MSYLVLARKYRPRDFEALVGQEHVVQALGNALTQQRLHHAYLFTGTRGVGKTTVSRILAKALNCTGADGQGGITAQPCGVCDACREIDSGRFVDYVELDAASNRGVDEIAQLLDQAVYKPVVGRFKVYMIDEVHMLSNFAFNAMLKTLEEPPEYLKFVLATTDPQKVPPTVLSRCLQFNLRPMAPQTVQEHLGAVLAKEGIEADAGALRLLSRAARGSMRDALSLTDQAIAFGNGRLDDAGVRQMLGAVDRGHAVRILVALAKGDGKALVAGVERLRGLGLSSAGTLEELAGMVQQMAVVQAVPSAADDTDPDTPRLIALSQRFSADELQLMYSIALHGREELTLAPDEYSGLVMVLLRMLAFMPAPEGGRAGADEAEVEPASSGRDAPVSEPAAADGSAAADAARQPASVPQAAPAPTRTAASAPATAALAERSPPPSAEPAPAPFESAPTPLAQAAVQPTESAPAEPVKPLSRASAMPAPAVASVAVPVSTPAVAAAVGRPMSREPVQSLPSAAGQASSFDDGPPAWVDAPMDDEYVSGAAPGLADAAFDEPPYERQSPRAGDERRSSSFADDASKPPVASRAAPVADPHAFERTATGERWAEVVRAMASTGAIIAMVRELALQAECVAIEENASDGSQTWRLRVERETLRGTASCQKLQTALSNLLGKPVKLETESGPTGDTPARRDAAALAARQREAERIIEEDPFVRSLMSQFKGARIVPGSVRPVDGDGPRTLH